MKQIAEFLNGLFLREHFIVNFTKEFQTREHAADSQKVQSVSELRILSEVERRKANLPEIEEEVCQIHLREV